MQQLLTRPAAVSGYDIGEIEADTRVFELECGSYHLHVIGPDAPGREEAERFIQQAYRRIFGAELNSFYASIVCLHDSRDRIVGAVGARHAEGQALFTEQYLKRPAEELISEQLGRQVTRNRVVELGNLSVARPALTYPFISMIGAWLQGYSVDWLLFSLTDSLRRLFGRSGIPMLDLGAADRSLLYPSGDDWGSYYSRDPRVMAAPLERSLEGYQLSRAGGRWTGGQSRPGSVDVPETCEAAS